MLTLTACAWACWGLVSEVGAQTLPQVVDRALQANPSIQSAEAKIQAARADIDNVRSAHQPQIGVTASSNHYASGSVPSSIERTSLSPTAKLNLWSGGRIEAEATRAEALTRASEFQHNGTLEDVAQQALVRMENASLDLQQRKANLAQAMQKLRRFWPDDMDARPVGLATEMSDGGVLGQIPMSLAAAMERVTDDLPGVAQYRAQVQAAEAAIKVAKGQYWPTLDAVTSRQYNANTLRFENFAQLQVNALLYTGAAASAAVAPLRPS